MIEIGQIFLRKDDTSIRTEVVGFCEHDGIEHYKLKVCGTELKRDIILSEEGIKIAYRLPSKSIFERLNLLIYGQLGQSSARKKNRKI